MKIFNSAALICLTIFFGNTKVGFAQNPAKQLAPLNIFPVEEIKKEPKIGLAGIANETFQISVSKPSQGWAADCSASQSSVKNKVELMFRSAGLKISDNSALSTLEIGVVCVGLETTQARKTGCACYEEVILKYPLIDRGVNRIGSATLWHRGSILTSSVGESENLVSRSINDQIEELLNGILKQKDD